MLTPPPRSQEISNPRGIPTAPFVEDVEAFVDSRADIEPNLKKFQEMIAFVFSLWPPRLPTADGSGGQEVPVHGDEHAAPRRGAEG